MSLPILLVQASTKLNVARYDFADEPVVQDFRLGLRKAKHPEFGLRAPAREAFEMVDHVLQFVDAIVLEHALDRNVKAMLSQHALGRKLDADNPWVEPSMPFSF